MVCSEAGSIVRTDLHTHILPGVDDGAAGLDEATAMARVALDDGTGCLAATPHNLRCPQGTDSAALAARAAELERHLATQGLALRVVPGAEMAVIPVLPQQIDAGEFATLNGSRYLLIELPYVGLPGDVEDIVEQVVARGLVPILAHPERSADLQRRPELLRRLVEGGLLMQITAASLEGRFGRAPQRMARQLLEQNLGHIIASDAHDAEDRTPRLAKAQTLAAEIAGAECALAMVTTTPAAILADEPIEVEPPTPRRRRRWFFM